MTILESSFRYYYNYDYAIGLFGYAIFLRHHVLTPHKSRSRDQIDNEIFGKSRLEVKQASTTRLWRHVRT